jgi:glutamine---fructose-6-phosphate transaminase (isomerizing)
MKRSTPHTLSPVPEAPLPLLAPLLSVVPGQLFAAALARAKGLDADSPTGLSKVTLAR